MIKELGILASAMSLYTGGVRSPQYRSHEVIENDIAITYKYESNEVNSNSDLVVGNLYHFVTDDLYTTSITTYSMSILKINSSNFSGDDNLFDENNYYDIAHDSDAIAYYYSGYLQFYNGEDSYTAYQIEQHNLSLDAVVILWDFDNAPSTFYNMFSYTDFNIIESVERVYPSNIFGYVSEFIDEHLLNGIPNIDDVSYSIGGKLVTMRSWLNTSICIVLAVLLIALLVWFIRYLFRLFSGLLH